VVGALAAEGSEPADHLDLPVLGGLNQLADVVALTAATRVVLAARR